MPRRTATGKPRTLNVSRQRKPQPSAKGKALQAVTGLLPGGRKPTPTSRSAGKAGKAGAGVAALTAAASVAFKNRDKLTSLFKRTGDSAGRATGGMSHSTSPTATPTSLEDPRSDTWGNEPPPGEQKT